MNPTPAWHDTPEFWQLAEPIIFSPARIAATPVEIDKIAALLPLPPASVVLDACCGIGRHSLELARRGHLVTGVDQVASYLARARQAALAEGLTVEFIPQDMRSFCRPQSFDAALSLFTSFGYYDDPAANQRVLLNIAASLKTGGKFLLDVHGKESLARIFQKRQWEQSGEYAVIEEHEVLDDWARVRNHWILLQGSERHDLEFTLRLYSATELKTMLLAAGFTAVQAYGSLDGIPYNHEAKRLIIVATK
jgi:SAM-dependent methyltransferase